MYSESKVCFHEAKTIFPCRDRMAQQSKKKATSRGVVQKATAQAAAEGTPAWFSRDWLWGLILLGAVVLAYQPVWYAGFIWDDDTMVTANPCIVGPLGLKEIWTTGAADICPLTLTTFWMEHLLWGLRPLPYHLVNILQHGACAILLWKVLRSLRVPGAWLGAAFWALHPVEVESVAWIAEMKNTQSALFFLLSILFFVRWLEAGRVDGQTRVGWDYGFTLLFAACAMASKSSTVILPLVLGLCGWWMEGRWNWRTLVKVSPIFLMSVVAAAVSIWTQKLHGFTENVIEARSWLERLATAGDGVWFYLGRLVWPHPLITIYPRWQIDAGQPFSYLSLLAVLVVLAVCWFKRGRWSRAVFFAFAYFLAALLPVLGLVNMDFFLYSFVADHFQYLAGIGPLALAAAGVVRLADFAIPSKPALRSSLGAGMLLILGVLSWQRAWIYQNKETLWTDTVAQNPSCWIAYNNLGILLAQKGRQNEAIVDYQSALELNPNYGLARNNLGMALVQEKHLDEAIIQFQKTLELYPNYGLVHDNLGIALVQKGRLDEAIVQFQKTLEINAHDARAHHNLGNVFFLEKRPDEAIAQFQDAIRLNPQDNNARNLLAKSEEMARQKANQTK
jgi:tetratricopeptide (TPR) repeat protein